MQSEGQFIATAFFGLFGLYRAPRSTSSAASAVRILLEMMQMMDIVVIESSRRRALHLSLEIRYTRLAPTSAATVGTAGESLYL